VRKFEYVKPSTFEDARDILAKFGESAKILNGGTDLIVRMRDNFIKPDYVVDIKGLPGMKTIEYIEDEGLFVGGAVTMNELVSNSEILNSYKILANSAHEVGSYQLRNRATLIGNACNASPSGDTLPALYVLDAKIKIYTKNEIKLIPVKDFILGVRKTILKTGEIAMGLVLPKLEGKSSGAYYKHSRRRDVDLATVSAAAFYYQNNWKVCFGAVAATPVRGVKTEEELNKLETINEETLKPALEVSAGEISPIDDIRASKEYRIEMIKIALKRAVIQAYDEFMK
jgi:carbon-monoxide dehydrogenase medium subunit